MGPWGTPQGRGTDRKEQSSIIILRLLSLKHEQNQYRPDYMMPVHCFNLEIKMLWSTVSKVMDKLRTTGSTESPELVGGRMLHWDGQILYCGRSKSRLKSVQYYLFINNFFHIYWGESLVCLKYFSNNFFAKVALPRGVWKHEVLEPRSNYYIFQNTRQNHIFTRTRGFHRLDQLFKITQRNRLKMVKEPWLTVTVEIWRGYIEAIIFNTLSKKKTMNWLQRTAETKDKTIKERKSSM